MSNEKLQHSHTCKQVLECTLLVSLQYFKISYDNESVINVIILNYLWSDYSNCEKKPCPTEELIQ